MIEPNTFLNCDCMELMKQIPDKYFDLAIVDPPYGGGCTDTDAILAGGGTDNWQKSKRSRFGGKFDKYHISNTNRRNVEQEISENTRGYL